MIRWDNIFESWAMMYKPLSHKPGKTSKEKAFYRVDSLNAENEFVRNINTAKSPAMAYSTLVDANAFKEKQISYVHTVYFLIKQKTAGLKTTYKNDDDAACECKVDLNDMCVDFCAFLAGLRNAACNMRTSEFMGISITSDVASAFRGVDISSVEWGSLPIFKNGWWVFAFQFEVLEPRLLCVNPEKYERNEKEQNDDK